MKRHVEQIVIEIGDLTATRRVVEQARSAVRESIGRVDEDWWAGSTAFQAETHRVGEGVARMDEFIADIDERIAALRAELVATINDAPGQTHEVGHMVGA